MVAMALPNDDVALEMEETEGFISQPDSPTKRNVSSSTSSSSSSSSFKHWTVALVLVIVCAGGGIAFVSYNSNNNNQSLENPNDASPNDVEQQWNTSIAEDDYGAGRYGPKDQIVRLERPLTQNQWDALTKEWGKWSFVDKQASTRPSPSFMDQFPNRDVPYDQFPKKAWQTDPVYLKDFLDEGLALVDRAMEAILAEYGSGKKHRPNLDLERRQNITFGIRWTNLTMTTNLGYPKGMLPPNGGWTTPKSFDGLVRRVLHAIMTQDTFTFILSGHSAAAGHGYVTYKAFVLVELMDFARVFLCFSQQEGRLVGCFAKQKPIQAVVLDAVPQSDGARVCPVGSKVDIEESSSRWVGYVAIGNGSQGYIWSRYRYPRLGLGHDRRPGFVGRRLVVSAKHGGR